MNSDAHFAASACSFIIACLVLTLGLIERHSLAGGIGFIVMLVIGVALARKGEMLAIDECISRRTFKGDYN